MKSRTTLLVWAGYLWAWAALLLAYPIGRGVGAAMSAGQDPAGTVIGRDLGTLCGVVIAVAAGAAISIGSGQYICRSVAGRTFLSGMPWLLVVLIVWVSLFPPSLRGQLRTDVSATVTYVGEHEEIALECSEAYGCFAVPAKRNEAVVVDSVRDDGLIYVAWGPDYNSKQEAELLVGPRIPEGGAPVVVAITLTDTEATYVIRRN